MNLKNGFIIFASLSVDTAFNVIKRSTMADSYNLIGSTHADEHYYTFG